MANDQQTQQAPPEAGAHIEPKPRADAPASNGSPGGHGSAGSNGSAVSNGSVESNGSAGAGVDPNYQYWRDHGGEWADGYDQRKKRQVLYHIQELMLTTYILQHALSAPQRPMTVLEFGCGVGRHLTNLIRLPDVDVYGYDQSPAMAQNIMRWAGKEWFESHIRLGMPTGKLPFPDKHFDIVYTAEVLVHVRPEHIDGILSELLRVCRGHVLHMETSEHMQLVPDSHNGCWRHDLVAAYARLGRECQVLPSGYMAHSPYRVVVGQQPRFTWSSVILEMCRRLERDIDEGFAQAGRAHSDAAYRATHFEQQAEALSADLAARTAELTASSTELGARSAELAARTADLARQASELEATRASLAELTTTVEAQAARADALEAQLGQARTDLAARTQEMTDQARGLSLDIASLTARVAGLDQTLAKERAAANAVAEQRRLFVAAALRLTRG